MADASCSGSTPLKSLAERGARDRSLQQNRYVQGPSGRSQFRAGPSPDDLPTQAYVGFTHGPGFTQTPNPLPSGPEAARHASVSMATMPGDSAGPFMGQFHAHGSPAPATNVVGSLGVGFSAQSWVADFASFNTHNNHADPGLYRQADSASSYMAHPTAKQHPRYEGPFVRCHPLAGSSAGPAAGPAATYVSGSNMPATHIQGTQHARHDGQTKSTAEAEFDNAMAQWMAINSHEEDVSGIFEDLAREHDTRQKTGLPEMQFTRGTDDLAGKHGEAAIPQETFREEVGGSVKKLTQARISSGMEDSRSLPDLSYLSLDASTRNRADKQPGSGNEGQASEVSEAARQLLETVRHEDGEKWQNSRFLHLMREFRDGTKSIIDDEIQETEKSRVSQPRRQTGNSQS